MVNPAALAILQDMQKRAGGSAAGGSRPPLGNSKKMAKAQRFLASRGIDPAQFAASLGNGSSTSGGGRVLSMDELNAKIKEINKSLPQDPVKNESGWSKGLGIVGKALDFIDTPGSYMRSQISTVAQGIEQGDITKILEGLPVVGEVAKTIDNFGGDPNAPKGLLSKVIFADKQQEKDFWANTGTGEYLQRGIEARGWEGTPIDNAWVKRGIGLAGDIGTDPLTWVSGGAKLAGGTAAKGAVVAGTELAEQAGEQAGKQLAKEGVERLAREGVETATKSVADDAAKGIGEAATKYKYARWDDWASRARDVAANTADDTERQWALGVVERVQRARDVSSLSSAELASLGGKRAVWVAGKPLFENNKVVEIALRAREAAGGLSRRGVGKAFKTVVGEGTFGNAQANKLMKGAMQAGGDNIARALDSIDTEKWARHVSGIEATNLSREGAVAMDALDKLGVDEQTVFRAVQDDDLFAQTAAAIPEAGQELDRVRGVYRQMAETIAADTGKVLGGGDTYAPHMLTPEAVEWLNRTPEAKKGIPGVASFEKTRSLRSGQDDTLLLSKMESTKMYGREIPRNLSDAQLVDWVNGTVKELFPDAPDFFDTNMRRVFDRSVGNYSAARHKGLFTQRMAERGWQGDDVRELASMMGYDTAARKEFIKEQADRTLKTVVDGANATEAQVRLVDDIERLLRETRAIGKRVGQPWDAMVSRFRSLTKSLADGGSVERVVREMERQRQVAIESARRAEGDLAKLFQAEVDFLGRKIRDLRIAIADADQGAYGHMLRQVGAGVADPTALKGELEAGAGQQVNVLRAGNEIAAQRARAQAEKNAPILASSRREAATVAKQVWGSVGSTVSEALSAKGVNKAAKQAPPMRSPKDAFIYGGPASGTPGRIGGVTARPAADMGKVARTARVKGAQDAIRAAVEEAGYTFTGFADNLDRVTVADLKKRLQDEVLEQVHGKTARIAGENAYQQRMLKGVSKEANKILGPLNKAADDIASYQAQLKQIPNPARYELMDFVGDNPKAAVLWDKMLRMTMRGDLLQARQLDAAAAENARLTSEIDDLARTVGLAGRQAGDRQIAVSAAGDASFAVEPQTTAQLRKAQREAAIGAGDAVDATRQELSDALSAAKMADEQIKRIIDLFFDDATAKQQPQPWKRTKNLSKEPTRQARQKVRGIMGARERAIILKNGDQLEEALGNAFANTVRDSFGELPADVQNLFMPVEQFFKNDGLRNFLNVYDKVNNSLKAWLIAKPGFVFRNLFGGMFVNMIAGVSPDAHIKMVKWAQADMLRASGRPGAWNKLSKFDKMVYEATREIQGSADTLVGSMVQRGKPSLLSRINPGSPNFFYLAANQGFNEAVENTFLRGSMIADALMKDPRVLAAYRSGDEVAIRRAVRDVEVNATRKVGFFHFDYNKAAKSPFENEVLARIVPFYTYTKNVIPMLVAMMVERPKYFAWANSVARNIQLGVPEEGVLPEYIRESGAIRTPFSVGGNRVYWMQDLPFNQLIDISNDPDGFVASSMSPLVKTPIELSMGKQFYKGIPITDDMKESRYANTPGVSQALSALGAQRTGANGDQFMQDRWQYALGQFVPPLYQASNYFPATDTQGLKLPTRATSDLTGVRLRVNTPEDQANELARQNIKEREKKAKKTREANRGYGNPADKSKR